MIFKRGRKVFILLLYHKKKNEKNRRHHNKRKRRINTTQQQKPYLLNLNKNKILNKKWFFDFMFL